MPENIPSQMDEYTIDEYREMDEEDGEYGEENEASMVNQTVNRTILSDTKVKRKFYQSFKPDFVNINEVTADGADTVVPV